MDTQPEQSDTPGWMVCGGTQQWRLLPRGLILTRFSPSSLLPPLPGSVSRPASYTRETKENRAKKNPPREGGAGNT